MKEALAQFLRRRELGHGARVRRYTDLHVVLDELMAVRREDERNVVELADSVGFALLKAVVRRKPFVLGFDDGHRNRLGLRLKRTVKHIISAASRTALALAINDVHRRCGFLEADVRARPSPLVDEARIDQVETGLGFIAGHQLRPSQIVEVAPERIVQHFRWGRLRQNTPGVKRIAACVQQAALRQTVIAVARTVAISLLQSSLWHSTGTPETPYCRPPASGLFTSIALLNSADRR